MSRARGQKQYIALAKGLITEASPLAAPEGSTSDERNMDLDLNGMIRVRRKGLEKQIADRGVSGTITGCYYWASAGYLVFSSISDSPDENKDTVYLYFIDTSDNSELVSYRFEVLEDTASNPSFSEVRNRLVTTFGANPFLFAKESSGNLSAWKLNLYIRDFKLVDDDLSVATRPSTLQDAHKYNIYNAGWYENQQLEGSVGDPVTDFNTRLGVYPSNADIVYLGYITNSNGITVFNADEMNTPLTGNTAAPRGHYVYNARNINRTSKLTSKGSDGTPSSTVIQVLDDGVNLTTLGTNLLFSDSVPTGDPVDPPIRPPKSGAFEIL